MELRNSFCPGPVPRRSFLEFGAAAIAGLSFPQLLRARELAAGVAPDTAVIFVWLPGGPPHMDTYDLKPDAPRDYRGIFRPIETNVPGMEVCELFPRHARIADKFNLIRSIHHGFADHGGGPTGSQPRPHQGAPGLAGRAGRARAIARRPRW